MAFLKVFLDIYLDRLLSLSTDVGGVLFTGLKVGLALGLREC
jgi:hypothetical protein